MLPQFLRAGNFKPKVYTGGGMRFYLPLLHDILAVEKPALIVTLGLGDAQAHLTFCQTAAQQNISSRCAAIRRATVDEDAADDPGWQRAEKATAEFFPTISQLIDGGSTTEFSDGSVNVLLIDDVDSAETIRRELELWSPKLSSDALVMLHGLDLERTDSPRSAWSTFAKEKAAAEFHDGIGLGIATNPAAMKSSPLREAIFLNTAALRQSYQLVADLMQARVQAKDAGDRAQMLEARQLWFDALFEDRRKAQLVMERQQGVIGDLEPRLAASRAQLAASREDRAKAQLVMENQFNQLHSLAAALEQTQTQLDKAHKQIADLKDLINVAKAACRKKGRCFDVRKEPKPKRTVAERVAREFARTKRRARRVLRGPEPAEIPAQKAEEPEERYKNWITEHEPIPEQLEQQWRESAAWEDRPKISLLIPVFNTPAKFLDELLESLVAQTYENWEACIVDGGSTEQATSNALRQWEKSEPRIQPQRLEQNLGVSENTNRALRNATGDFVALVDHDDRLPPFALYELAAAIRREAGAEIFYSDEDRLSEAGVRGKPFFKPEWSPELLFSFMYVGHLTAYRRAFALELGGFRKEFDLSQDYDFALRATERAKKIVHIPHVLYHWREHPASGAAGGKPEARKTNLTALAAAVRRRGWDADVIEYPTANRVRMRLPRPRRVSVIIPTDSPIRAKICARDLPTATTYGDAEFVIVTNSALIEQLRAASEEVGDRVRLVPFDKPFNFSAKCNAGARAATGERLIFFNDDVESTEGDWIENIIEPLENPEVGAVSPKLVYTTGKIQHAGLVTGVRGLVGTAMHQWPADSTDYTNFAQSMRTVSALSAACLAMRREDFFSVAEFDEINTPIAHSDLDLCFKLREAGLRCVYTPFATMTHRGHVSIGPTEQEKTDRADKSSVFLLQRWAHFTGRDPFFTDNMRDWLYHDSPTPVRMFAARNSATGSWTRDILLVSHELSLSGAPIILAHLAKWCRANGIFVVVMSPVDGPLRETFLDADIPLIVDPLLATGYEMFTKFGRGSPVRSHQSFIKFARGFDTIVASTIFAAPLIRDAQIASVPSVWWIHEGLVGDHFLKKYPRLGNIFEMADIIATPNEESRRIYQPFTSRRILVWPYGIPDVPVAMNAIQIEKKRVRFLLLGTVEPRKGQQTFVRAVRQLPHDVRERSEFLIVGRPHDTHLAEEVRAAAKSVSHLHYQESIPHANAMALIHNADVMVCASCDETGPLTLIEGMALGKPILSTPVGLVAEKLVAGTEALFVKSGDVEELLEAIVRLVREPELRRRLAINSRRAYEKHFTLDRFAKDFVALIDKADLAETGNVGADVMADALSSR
ncbi:MAG: hypothetical protein DME44_10800 [Verrucomicrobia bacterium]|nr:MAG: hypothetical protein DME44_10800 [Verrucomicrobiota bacterium]